MRWSNADDVCCCLEQLAASRYTKAFSFLKYSTASRLWDDWSLLLLISLGHIYRQIIAIAFLLVSSSFGWWTALQRGFISRRIIAICTSWCSDVSTVITNRHLPPSIWTRTAVRSGSYLCTQGRKRDRQAEVSFPRVASVNVCGIQWITLSCASCHASCHVLTPFYANLASQNSTRQLHGFPYVAVGSNSVAICGTWKLKETCEDISTLDVCWVELQSTARKWIDRQTVVTQFDAWCSKLGHHTV